MNSHQQKVCLDSQGWFCAVFLLLGHVQMLKTIALLSSKFCVQLISPHCNQHFLLLGREKTKMVAHFFFILIKL